MAEKKSKNADLKTKLNDAPVEKFLDSVEEEQRKDAYALLEIMKKSTGETPKMWGASIVGFGSYHYKGKSGREGEWFMTGFSPRKQNMTVYIYGGFQHYEELLKKLGKHTTSAGGCLYFKKLADIDTKVLVKMLEKNMKLARAHKA